MDRRDFFRKGVAGAAALGAGALLGCSRPGGGMAGAPLSTPASQDTAAAGPAIKIGASRYFEDAPGEFHAAIASGSDASAMVSSALVAFGGLDAVFSKGDRVVIKPNLAWGRGPDIGANTSPEVLRAVIDLAKQGGAGEVLVVEHTCDQSAISFEMSGGQEICDAAGVRLISLDNEGMYSEIDLAGAANITSDLIARELLECDVYINVPALKHHGATGATVAMKNQMGCNWDRQRYHREGKATDRQMNLHQNIADLARGLRPTLVVVDATRALTANGPKGPGPVDETNAIIVSHDMVTADALGVEMLGKTVDEVAHVRLAAEAGVGRLDLDALNIARL